MALVTQDLSCTGTGNATIQRDPSANLNATGTSVPTLLKLPSRALAATGTSIGRILKSPLKVLSVSSNHTIVLSLIRFGIDTFDIIEGKRKWFITQGGKWAVSGKKRFTFLVRGKPSG